MTEANTTNSQPAKGRYAALRYEPEMFRGLVSGMGLPQHQQDALMEDVWLIVVGVIDSALGLHHHSDFNQPENCLAPESDGVLRSVIILKENRTKDARAEKGVRVPRKDS